DRPLHQLEGRAIPTTAFRNRDRAKKRDPVLPFDGHGPDPHNARHALGIHRDEAGLGNLAVALAQALCRLGEPARPEDLVIEDFHSRGMLGRVEMNLVSRNGVHGPEGSEDESDEPTTAAPAILGSSPGQRITAGRRLPTPSSGVALRAAGTGSADRKTRRFAQEES